MDLFLQLLANGLITGTFYALSALGLTLVFGLMRVVNFAHGELYMVGGLIGWSLTAQTGLNFFASLALVIAGDGSCRLSHRSRPHRARFAIRVKSQAFF